MKPPVQKGLFRHSLLSTLNEVSTLVILDPSPTALSDGTDQGLQAFTT